jgi:hypothetical protein
MRSALRKQAINLALIAVACGLGTVVLVTQGRPTTAEMAARENHLLGAFRRDEITRIELRSEGSTAVIERSRDATGSATWNLVAPVREAADAYAIDKLIGTLEHAIRARTIAPTDVDRSRFGLARPRTTIEVAMGGIDYEVRLGGVAASPQGAHYVEVVGKDVPHAGVAIVSGDTVRELSVGADELRDRQLIPYVSGAISGIVLDGLGGRRELTRDNDASFRFAGQHDDRRISREAIEAVLLQLSRTKAEHLVSLDRARQAQSVAEKVHVTVRPKPQSQPAVTLVIGGPCPVSEHDVLAVREAPAAPRPPVGAPIAGCVPASTLTALSVPAEQLVDRGLFSLNLDEIETLRVSRGNTRLELSRSGKAFTAAGQVVELEPGNRRISALLELRGELVASANLMALGLDPGDGAVEVRSSIVEGQDKPVEQRVRFSAARDSYVHVLREQDGAVLKLPEAALSALATEVASLQSSRVFDFAPTDVRQLEISTDNLVQRLERSQTGELRLVAPLGFDGDAALASDLIEALSSLNAERWLPSADGLRFEPPKLRATITLATGDASSRQTSLLLGESAPEGVFARTDAGAFVIDRSSAERLSTLLLDRAVFLLPRDAARVELRGRSSSAVLVRSETNYEQLSGTAKLSRGDISEIIESLSTLRAEAAIQIGRARPEHRFSKPILEVIYETAAADAGKAPAHRFAVGAADTWREMSVHYVRADGVDATYVVGSGKLVPLLDRL